MPKIDIHICSSLLRTFRLCCGTKVNFYPVLVCITFFSLIRCLPLCNIQSIEHEVLNRCLSIIQLSIQDKSQKKPLQLYLALCSNIFGKQAIHRFFNLFKLVLPLLIAILFEIQNFDGVRNSLMRSKIPRLAHSQLPTPTLHSVGIRSIFLLSWT